MKRVAIIQARMTSTRLPGKVMLDLDGKPLLVRQIERLERCTALDAICIATTTNETDDVLVESARRAGVLAFRGSETDVLSRYLGAAAHARAQLVVRITSDCPLIMPAIVDEVVRCALEDPPCDYVSNTLTRRFPRGLDCEAIALAALERAGALATSVPAREHVTWFIHRERPELFTRREVVGDRDDSDLRWTVDTVEDLAMVRALWGVARLGERDATYDELVAIARAHPEITALNKTVEQKSS
jgi:spore coat polysaccharide biosynthesis protein SpsF